MKKIIVICLFVMSMSYAGLHSARLEIIDAHSARLQVKSTEVFETKKVENGFEITLRSGCTIKSCLGADGKYVVTYVHTAVEYIIVNGDEVLAVLKKYVKKLTT